MRSQGDFPFLYSDSWDKASRTTRENDWITIHCLRIRILDSSSSLILLIPDLYFHSVIAKEVTGGWKDNVLIRKKDSVQRKFSYKRIQDCERIFCLSDNEGNRNGWNWIIGKERRNLWYGSQTILFFNFDYHAFSL